MSEIDIVILERIIERHFGKECMISRYDIVQGNTEYAVVSLMLTNPSERVVLKLAGQNAAIACPFDRTFALNKQVRNQTSAPTFEALAVDVSYEYVPYRYLLMSYIEGIPWASMKEELHASDLQKVYRELGHAVAQFHTISYGSFGEISMDKKSDDANYLSALIARAKRRIKNRHHQQLFVTLLEQNKVLFQDVVSPRLTHEDLNPGNIIIRQQGGCWVLAGIIDFDSAWAGGHESDLARLELWRGMISTGFFEEYERSQSISKNYPKRRPFLQLLWCLEFALPSEEHHATTKDVCHRLGIPAITF